MLQDARWPRLAIRLVAFALLVVLALRLRQLWQQHPVDLSEVDGALLALAALFSLVAVIAYGCVWPLILERIGVTPPSGSVRIFLQSQLGKYVPGSVWHYAGRIGLARSRGVPVRVTALSLGIELAGSSLAALAVALFLLPVVVALPSALALVAIAIVLSRVAATRPFLDPPRGTLGSVLRLGDADRRRALATLLPVSALYVPVWLTYGLAFWFTGRALFPIPVDDFLYFTAAFALGWLAGMIAVFAPGGIGVREAVLVALVGPRVGQAEAIVIAAVSRILLTGADLVGGGAALLLPRLRFRRVAGAAQ